MSEASMSWLSDDVNGFLASGNPPTSIGLARAIADCVRDENTYRRLCLGALEMSERFRRASHLLELEQVFTAYSTGIPVPNKK